MYTYTRKRVEIGESGDWIKYISQDEVQEDDLAQQEREIIESLEREETAKKKKNGNFFTFRQVFKTCWRTQRCLGLYFYS